TGNITASGSAANGTNQAGGNAGVVSITGSGTLNTAAIAAQTGAATGTGAGGTTGSIALTGTTVTAGALTTTGGSNGAGGNVSATASTGLLNVTGAITTSGGTALTNTAGRSAGTVTLAGNSVTTAAITANGTAGSGANMAGGNGAAVTVTGSGGNVSVGAISVTGANAGTGSANGGNAGSITLDAGGATPLITLNGNLTATGGNRIGAGTAGSGGQVWVKDAAAQTANLTVNTTGGTTGGTGGAIRLDGALNEDATARTLTLTAGTGAVTLAGGTATSAVTTLSATGASIALGSVQTKGTQSYTGVTSLNGNLATLGTAGADTITFNSPVTLTGNSSITTAGGAGDNIVIAQTINGAHDLTLNAGTSGNITTTAGIGQTTALGAFSATGAAVSLGAVRAAGIVARSTIGNLTLTGTQTATGGGDSVVLVAKQNFVNNVGAAAINSGPGRWLVYSTSPTSDTRNGLVANFKQYNATYGDTILGTGNGFLHTVAPTVTAGLTGAVTKVYDGNTNATLTAGNYTSSAGIDGDVVTLNNPTAGNYADKNVGTGKTVSVSGITASASNGATTVYGYQVSGGGTATGNIGDITARALTVSATGTNKAYDATTNAVVGLSDNRVAGDILTASSTAASFVDKNVGVNKVVNVTGINVTGTDAANYTFNTAAATTANITPATIAGVTGITANTKVADGNTAAALNTGAAGFTGMFGGDVLNVAAATGNFDTAAPGIDKPVAITGIALGGADAGNYVLASNTASTVATIVDAAGQGGAFRPSMASSITLPTAVLAPASAGLSVAAMNALLESAPSAAGPCADPETACAAADSAVLVQTLREPVDQRPGIVSVGVSSELVSTGAAFRFALPKGLMVMAGDAAVEATTLSGKPLPAWLRFDAVSGAFTAAGVPSGALPQQLRVGLGARSVVLTMSETAMAAPALRNAAAKPSPQGG
ncbi:beta strand repeat-containing protein, partial [Polaromonas sp.]|uniref:beta strand repeat-containing protein n=1 Tax=Polaromonas sp. TaxID=1869339 RepID=UPI003CA83A0B